MLGLARGKVELYDHDTAWEENAKQTIIFLKEKFGEIVVDIQHIGSTAIKHIKAKPIIDIVVGINDFNKLKCILSFLSAEGIIRRPNNDLPEYMMFVMGDFDEEIRTHHIHVVSFNGEEWNNQINFRDYMNAHPDKAKEYETIKIDLMNSYAENRSRYTSSKQPYIDNIFIEAAEWKQPRK